MTGMKLTGNLLDSCKVMGGRVARTDPFPFRLIGEAPPIKVLRLTEAIVRHEFPCNAVRPLTPPCFMNVTDLIEYQSVFGIVYIGSLSLRRDLSDNYSSWSCFKPCPPLGETQAIHQYPGSIEEGARNRRITVTCRAGWLVKEVL